jgi:DNA-directed RNA polymerase subunit RPC12/RpoP
MTDETVQILLKCSHCGRELVTAPKDYDPEGRLTCPGCNAWAETPTRIPVTLAAA